MKGINLDLAEHSSKGFQTGRNKPAFQELGDVCSILGLGAWERVTLDRRR